MKKVLIVFCALILFLSGCQIQKTHKTPETTSNNEKNESTNENGISHYISVNSLEQLEEMRTMIETDDEEELNLYLDSNVDTGVESRDDLISFLELIDSLPVLELIEGDVSWIALMEGNSIDTEEYSKQVFITTKASNGNWTRIQYLISVNDIPEEIEKRKIKGKFTDSTLDNPIHVNDGRIKIYGEIREKHPSGNGDFITWILDLDGIFVTVAYYINDSNTVNTENLFNKANINSILEYDTKS